MADPTVPTARPRRLRRDRLLARATQPLLRFVGVEAAGGIVLIAATTAALVWANSPWQEHYGSFWSTSIRIEVGSYVWDEDLVHVVSDLLMAIFFFVVGMEIKREIVVGELRDRRAMALPALAALGGMVVPAVLYTAFNVGSAGADGWGIPMATDIAFALGVVTVLGRRVPPAVKVLLLTLAIVDDVGAIAVIAVFYATDLGPRWLVVAAAISVVIGLMHRAHVTTPVPFVIAGAALWLAVYESGVHATIAGVVFGLLTPARPAGIADDTSPCDRLIEAFHPWTSFVVLPVFALANAGIPLSADTFSDPSSVFVGIAVGLVIGKLVGVVSFSWLAVRLGLGRLPGGVRWRHMVGVGAVAGIGFTVSLFISRLAFESAALQDDAKSATLAASLIAATIGALVFLFTGRLGTTRSEGA
jgi:NhaA family Na+:H+ antiporter